MTDEMIALGRRAAACKGWRWMRGMAVVANFGVYPVWGRVHDAHGLEDGLRVLWDSPQGIPTRTDDPAFRSRPIRPVLTDPATVGCLLAMVREAWDDPTVRTSYVTGTYPHRWVVLRHGLLGWKTKAHGNTEAEALVAALEAAP